MLHVQIRTHPKGDNVVWSASMGDNTTQPRLRVAPSRAHVMQMLEKFSASNGFSIRIKEGLSAAKIKGIKETQQTQVVAAAPSGVTFGTGAAGEGAPGKTNDLDDDVFEKHIVPLLDNGHMVRLARANQELRELTKNELRERKKKQRTFDDLHFSYKKEALKWLIYTLYQILYEHFSGEKRFPFLRSIIKHINGSEAAIIIEKKMGKIKVYEFHEMFHEHKNNKKFDNLRLLAEIAYFLALRWPELYDAAAFQNAYQDFLQEHKLKFEGYFGELTYDKLIEKLKDYAHND